MLFTASPSRLGALGLAGALLLPAVASADAITSATGSVFLSIEEIVETVSGNEAPLDVLNGGDISAIYYFDDIPGTNPMLSESSSGNAVVSASSTPEDTTQDALLDVGQPAPNQASSSVAEAYSTGAAGQPSTANASSGVEGVIEFENTGTIDYDLTIGYEILLNVVQELTGVGMGIGTGYTYAFAEYSIIDDMGLVDLTGSIDLITGGLMADELDISDAFSFTLAAGSFNSLSIMVNTQADAEFRVPTPATAALLALGLIGVRGLRRRMA
jgi:hypothetical protein